MASSSNASHQVIFKSLVTDESGGEIQTPKGILCQVFANGKETVMAIERNSLVAANILPEVCLTIDADDESESTITLTPQEEEPTRDRPRPRPSCSDPPEEKSDIEWDSSQSRLLLDKYEQYLSKVGPLKKFKTKKIMWAQIALDLKAILHTNKTPLQCENRFKTIMKRKVKTVKDNSTSGSARQNVEFEEELGKIKAIDDSVEPEVLRGVGKVSVKRRISEPVSDRPTKKMTVLETLLKIHDEKEKKKQQRHEEKMELIAKLLG